VKERFLTVFIYRHLLNSSGTFLYYVFLIFLSDNFCDDDMLMPVFFCSGSYVINNVLAIF